jgi:hypothetical protein
LSKAPKTSPSFPLALAIFVLVNLALSMSVKDLQVSPFSLPASPSYDFHRANKYRQDCLTRKRAPEVVLFGSSLMMIPQAAKEADYLKKDIDPVINPYSTYLSDCIFKETGARATCFNFALPGGMISDHFLISKTLFQGQSKPKVAVLGITLRDFIDNGVDCAATTPAFNYFSRFLKPEEKQALLPLTMPRLQDRLEYYITEALYLYGNRIPAQVLGESYIQRLLRKPEVIKASIKETPAQEARLSCDAEALLKGKEVLAGAYFIKPGSSYTWKDNTREYKQRFKSAHQNLFENQKVFLSLTTKLLKAQGITPLFVNMPLTRANQALMPRGSYEQYLSFLKTFASQEDIPLLDLNDNSFDQSHFMDTAHMNSKGGEKLFAAIARQLAQFPKYAEALWPAAPKQNILTQKKYGQLL